MSEYVITGPEGAHAELDRAKEVAGVRGQAIPKALPLGNCSIEGGWACLLALVQARALSM